MCSRKKTVLKPEIMTSWLIKALLDDKEKKSGVALMQLSLTLHYDRKKNNYQHYIHI